MNFDLKEAIDYCRRQGAPGDQNALRNLLAEVQAESGGAIPGYLLEEIARELDLPEGDVSEALDAICAPLSLHDPVYSDGGDPLTVMDQIHDTKNTEQTWMERIALRSAYQALGSREKQILSLRFVGGKTQMEVAGALGISQAQVSRLEKNAICSMGKAFTVS